ncbi:hypothetical protein F5141DRAFT_1059470 [Pisolithus sp. B1]|nr:hypothetical protein F5141DRAFT_1059470 [Pisolithus sp. B1]
MPPPTVGSAIPRVPSGSATDTAISSGNQRGWFTEHPGTCAAQWIRKWVIDGSRSGTATTPPNYHVPAALPPPGFNPGYRCPPYPASDALSGEVSFTPENETSSPVTRGPYPHMQPPSVFFQPFPQPLPYPTSPLGPNLWVPNYSWHEEMPHPSAVQDLPRLLVPPSAHDVNVEPKFRNHLPRRQHRREGQAGYHRNSQSRAPIGR